jgi:hypothetical protein
MINYSIYGNLKCSQLHELSTLLIIVPRMLSPSDRAELLALGQQLDQHAQSLQDHVGPDN